MGEYSLLFAWQSAKLYKIHGTLKFESGVLLMADSLSFIWSHLVHFTKFPVLRFVKHYCSPNVYPISSKVIIIMGNTRYYFFCDLPKIKKNMAF